MVQVCQDLKQCLALKRYDEAHNAYAYTALLFYFFLFTIMFDSILQLDTQLTLALNGSDSVFVDNVFWLITKTRTWLPLVPVLLYGLWRKHSWQQLLLLLGMIALCIFCADRVASGWAKPTFERLRPTQDPALAGMIDMVHGYTSGLYGFFSSHAANSSVLFAFFSLLYRNRWLTALLLSWTLLNGYSRIYLGVHYVGDVVIGTLWGCFVGYSVYRFYCYLVARYATLFTTAPRNYTQQDSMPLVLSIAISYAMILSVASGM